MHTLGHAGQQAASLMLTHHGGGTERPIPAEEVIAKFREVTAQRVPWPRQDEIIALCERLEALPDAAALLAPLQS